MKGSSVFPAKWIFCLSAVVILAAVFAVIAMLFGFGSSSITFKYPITMALVCFALSSVSCLLFAATAEIKATVGILVVSIAGPAAMWVGALLIVNKIFPPPVGRESLIEALRGEDMKGGWITFPAWESQLGQLQEDVKADEADQIGQLMDTAYNMGKDRNKLSDPVIQVLFVYLQHQTVKFERIQGEKSGAADIFYKGQTTFPGRAMNMLLAKANGHITESYSTEQSDWVTVSSDPVDCLVVTLYDEGMLTRGDLLYLTLPKYLKFGSVTLDIGIVAPDEIETPRLWLVRGLPFAAQDEIPMVFKDLRVRNQTTVEPLFDDLSSWMALLERVTTQQHANDRLSDEGVTFLQGVRNSLPESSFVKLATGKNFKTIYSSHMEGLQEGMVVTLVKK